MIYEEDVMKRAIIYYSLSDNTKEAAEYMSLKSTFGMTPKIKGVPENIDVYDEIIIGTPIWAGKAASPINSLLKYADIADKSNEAFSNNHEKLDEFMEGI